MLDIKQANEHCKSSVKKFDYYSYRVAMHLPVAQHPHYFAINAFFIEVMRSREISRERSICQTRLHWWAEILKDIEAGRPAREPVSRMLQEVKNNTKVNFKLLHRMVDYQLFDIDRGDITTIQELEIYAENTRSLLFYMNLHLLSIDDKKANLIASHLGRAYGICDIIKKSPFYIAHSRSMMPLDIMARHDVVTDRIYSRTGGESIVNVE